MFRCITELKGLAVDIDSFPTHIIREWIEIEEIIPCVFLTNKDDISSLLRSEIRTNKVIYLEKYEKCFSPSKITHLKVLKALNIKNTELVYVSCDHYFLEKANRFLSGTIWITNQITYQQASKAPDMILMNTEELKDALRNHMSGFYGEAVVFPQKSTLAMMLPVEFEVDEEEVPLYALGRYFSNSHYMNQLHPYSSAIYLNKKPGKSYSGSYNKVFRSIYYTAVNHIKGIHDIDSILSVPVRPGRVKRFDEILSEIAKDCNIQNVGDSFSCIKDYPDQKGLSTEEREQNVKGVFQYSGDLRNHNVVLIDDVISTGATVKECVRVLKRKGARKVVIITLAINQFGSYWSSNIPQVGCPVCHSKMTLLLNGRGQFFYSCLECYRNGRSSSTMDFADGWKQLCENENQKFKFLLSQERQIIQEDQMEEIMDWEPVVKCPHCSSKNRISLIDFGRVSTIERNMGTETLYEFDNDEIVCKACKNAFQINGYVSIYPPGTVERIALNVEAIDEGFDWGM